jgi:predicted ATPase/transcriptional regulator with XRE-family HTH domain
VGTLQSPSFGEVLRRYRRAAGLTQEELAEQARLSVRAIADLERGARRWPYKDTVALLADALALPAEERAALIAAARRPRAPAAARAAPPRPTASCERPPCLLLLPLTPLLGREHEEAAVMHLLRRDPHAGAPVRLLTLTGPGGVGKTRLALQVAEALQDAYADGVVFVSLAALGDPALVAATLAQALGLRETGGAPLQESLVEALRLKHMLLLLDNFEQVGAAAPLLADLLSACRQLTVLVTSRAALHVQGEHHFDVPPLALPDAAQEPTAEAMARSPAVALFVQRAQAVRPTFQLTETTAPAVAAICRRLDGLPLAIELAAAWIKVLAPQTLLERLAGARGSTPLQLLTDGGADRPWRQHTLRHTIVWSHDLLAGAEQALFRRLAVFAGGCSLDAAEAVCSPAWSVPRPAAAGPTTTSPAARRAPPGGAPSTEAGRSVLHGLAALVDKSLLRVEDSLSTRDAGHPPQVGRTADPDAEPRFTMLETIREYARECLAASAEDDALRRAHATYFLALAEEAAPALTGPGQAAWLPRLEREQDNLRSALQWAQESGEPEVGLRLAGALWRFWYVRGQPSEGRGWLEGLLALAGSDGPAGVAASVRAQALHGAGVLARLLGDYGRATALHEESLTLRRGLHDTAGIAASLGGLGLVADHQGDYLRAAALYEEGLALCREIGDQWGSASMLSNLGQAAIHQGDYARAAALYAESLALARHIGDRWGIAVALNNVGDVARHQGDDGRAAAACDESLALFGALGDRRGRAYSLSNLGDVARDRGDDRTAATLYEQSLALRRELCDKQGVAMTLTNLGHVARAQGDHARARALYGESLLMYRQVDSPVGQAECLEGMAGVACAHQQYERAARLCGTAAALRAAIGSPLSPAEQATLQSMLATVGGALGAQMFAVAWATGRAMPLEQAVDGALTALVPERA